MTAPTATAVKRCITDSLANANVAPNAIDTINGHLTATSKDGLEIQNWSEALKLSGKDFPYINSLKSMVGHCLSASGSVESVASVLQLYHGFIFPNINCEDLHPDITAIIDENCIPQQVIKKELNIVAKASFGFGDVNACVLFKKYN
jgi:3-oxoacyl-(acyl-carrier-protein) synthase